MKIKISKTPKLPKFMHLYPHIELVVIVRITRRRIKTILEQNIIKYILYLLHTFFCFQSFFKIVMALTKAFHWQQEDYFPYLLKNNVKTAVVALEYLVDDIHEGKEATVDMLLKHKQSDTLLYGLIKLMSSDNLRVSGNSAYVFGTVAESEEGIERIMELLQDENNLSPSNTKIHYYGM